MPKSRPKNPVPGDLTLVPFEMKLLASLESSPKLFFCPFMRKVVMILKHKHKK